MASGMFSASSFTYATMAVALLACHFSFTLASQLLQQNAAIPHPPRVTYNRAQVNGMSIFYRSAGNPASSAVVLLHGFPTSSHYYRNLVPALAAQGYFVIAPDYPGFGYSDMPTPAQFNYTFDSLAAVVAAFLKQLGVEKYSIYVQDYGAPVGFRLFQQNPSSIQAIISQNGNVYKKGLCAFWDQYLVPFWKNRNNASAVATVMSLLTLGGTQLQYTVGYRNVTDISPDAPTLDQVGLDRPGNAAIQLSLFYDYQNNLKLYPVWQATLRKVQPPVLAEWGKNDFIFCPAGARAFKQDVPSAQVKLLNTGHFALEEDGDVIAADVAAFLKKALNA